MSGVERKLFRMQIAAELAAAVIGRLPPATSTSDQDPSVASLNTTAVRIFEDMVNYVNQADTMTAGIWQPPADSGAPTGGTVAATNALQQIAAGLATVPGLGGLAGPILAVVAGALGVAAPSSTAPAAGSGTTVTSGTIAPLTPAIGH